MGDRGAIWFGLAGRLHARVYLVEGIVIGGMALAGRRQVYKRTGCCDRWSNKIKVVKPLEQTHLNIHNYNFVLWPIAKEERTITMLIAVDSNISLVFFFRFFEQ